MGNVFYLISILMLQCNCGAQTNSIRYKNGHKTCNKCATINLSGEFLRRLEGEARYYERDIQQKYQKNGQLNPNFVELYGKGRNVK